MQVIFKDQEHKSFYNKKVMEYSGTGRVVDSYTKSLMYLPSSNSDTRRNFDNLFNIKNGEIKTEGMKGGWLTETTRRICRLAFNLFNGYTQDGRRKCSEDFTPYYLGYEELGVVLV